MKRPGLTAVDIGDMLAGAVDKIEEIHNTKPSPDR